jgi:hypothetical protein
LLEDGLGNGLDKSPILKDFRASLKKNLIKLVVNNFAIQ